MARRIIVALTIVSLGAGLAGCGGDDAEPATTTTTTVEATTTTVATTSSTTSATSSQLPPAVAAAISTCAGALDEVWETASVTDNPSAAIFQALNDGSLLEACEFLLSPEGPPAEWDVPPEAVIAQLEQEIDPALYDLLTRSDPIDFSDTAGDL